MGTIKTTVNDANVEDFIRSVADATRRTDALTLLNMYTGITGKEARMWGSSIVGFDQFHYKSERSKQEGDWPIAAFSPRKQNLTLYFTPGFGDMADLLKDLGKHKTSVSCLYINKLADIDQKVLEKMIRRDYESAKKRYS